MVWRIGLLLLWVISMEIGSMALAQEKRITESPLQEAGESLGRYGDLLRLEPARKESGDALMVKRPFPKASGFKKGSSEAPSMHPIEGASDSDALRVMNKKYQAGLGLAEEKPETAAAMPDLLKNKYQEMLMTSSAPVAGGAGGAEISVNQFLKSLESDASNYEVGPGDILEISVWKDASLSKSVTVLPDGFISLPLAGDIMASGKKVNELKGEIVKRLSHFMADPVVSISVHQVNSMMIYIIGKVNNPGRFMLNNPINVLQALSMAGGLNTFADGNKIKIFRNSDILNFKYKDVAEGVDVDQNIQLQRGDVIVIP